MNKEKFPNIMLLTIDCLRFDHLSFAGYHLRTTPCIDELIFRYNAWYFPMISTAPYTKASFKSIMTGMLPFTKGGYHTIRGLTSFMSLLKKEGYFTIGIPNNPVFLSDGYEKDFDFFIIDKNITPRAGD